MDGAEMVPSSPASRRSRAPAISSPSGSGRRSDDRLSADRTQSASSCRLEDFRRLHASGLSDSVFRLVTDSWRRSTSARYDAAWRAFKDFLRSRRISLDSVDLTVVLDYLSFLFQKGLAYRTICLHRSVLSMTLPRMDGLPVGEHRLVCRLIKGIFHQRPPQRRVYQPWDVGKVLAVFSAWTPPLNFKQLQRKAAFLIAMASARRPSELASLRCSPAFMSRSTTGVRFIPSALSKTDRHSHLGPPISISRLESDDATLCPVASIDALLQARQDLGIRHDYVFCDFLHPHAQISAAAFARRLAWPLRRAGISAPPSSTRSVSVSDAFARGVDLAAILNAGDWSGAQTFFRHYLRPSSASFHQ